MTPTPTPPSATTLDALTAGLLQADPGARVAARSPRAVHLKLSDAPNAAGLLLLPDSREALAAEVQAALAAMKKGTILRIVAIDLGHLGATDVLKAEISAIQVRSVIQAFSWTPGSEPEVARGSKWPALLEAVKRFDEGTLGNPEAVIAQRAEHGADADEFLAQLNARKPVVTYAVAAFSVALFGLQMLWGSGEAYASGMRMGASVRSLIEQGQVWRLLAPMVLHGNIVHLLMNMLALFGFGTFLEKFLGWRRYLSLYVLAGLGGGIASFLRPNEVISVGASGGIWGLMLAGAVLVTWPSGRLPALVSEAQRKRAWSPVVINGLYSLQPGIDLLAHFGGGFVGALAMFVLMRGLPQAEAANDPGVPPRQEKAWVTVLALGSAAALLAAVVLSFATGRPWELSSQPKLTTLAVSEAQLSLSLPTLIGPRSKEGEKEYVFGRLQYDPVAFVVMPMSQHLTPAELEDPKAALQGLVDLLNAPGAKGAATPIAGFTRVGKFEVREKAGRPYAFGAQVAPDGRRGESYWVIDGDRFALVLVLSSNAASTGWRTAAAEVPFTLKFDSPATEPGPAR